MVLFFFALICDYDVEMYVSFRVDELNSKEFKWNVEKAKTCRELIRVSEGTVLNL